MKMKLLCGTIPVFAVVLLSLSLDSQQVHSFSLLPTSARSASASFTATSTTSLNMFGGGGELAAKEDDPEEQAKLEAAAKAMGMPVAEYQLGMMARNRLTQELDASRITTGDDRVQVVRCGNNPPRVLDITISESGKAMGATALSKELCSLLKKASDESRVVRGQAQKNMMAFIGEEMKRAGLDK